MAKRTYLTDSHPPSGWRINPRNRLSAGLRIGLCLRGNKVPPAALCTHPNKKRPTHKNKVSPRVVPKRTGTVQRKVMDICTSKQTCRAFQGMLAVTSLTRCWSNGFEVVFLLPGDKLVHIKVDVLPIGLIEGYELLGS